MKNTLAFRHTFKSGASCVLRVDLGAVAKGEGKPFRLEVVSFGDAAAMRKEAAELAALEALLSAELAGDRPPLKSGAPEARAWIRAVVEHLEAEGQK